MKENVGCTTIATVMTPMSVTNGKTNVFLDHNTLTWMIAALQNFKKSTNIKNHSFEKSLL